MLIWLLLSSFYHKTFVEECFVIVCKFAHWNFIYSFHLLCIYNQSHHFPCQNMARIMRDLWLKIHTSGQLKLKVILLSTETWERIWSHHLDESFDRLFLSLCFELEKGFDSVSITTVLSSLCFELEKGWNFVRSFVI